MGALFLHDSPHRHGLLCEDIARVKRLAVPFQEVVPGSRSTVRSWFDPVFSKDDRPPRDAADSQLPQLPLNAAITPAGFAGQFENQVPDLWAFGGDQPSWASAWRPPWQRASGPSAQVEVDLGPRLWEQCRTTDVVEFQRRAFMTIPTLSELARLTRVVAPSSRNPSGAPRTQLKRPSSLLRFPTGSEPPEVKVVSSVTGPFHPFLPDPKMPRLPWPAEAGIRSRAKRARRGET